MFLNVKTSNISTNQLALGTKKKPSSKDKINYNINNFFVNKDINYCKYNRNFSYFKFTKSNNFTSYVNNKYRNHQNHQN